jgi:hypothetical protein
MCYDWEKRPSIYWNLRIQHIFTKSTRAEDLSDFYFLFFEFVQELSRSQENISEMGGVMNQSSKTWWKIAEKTDVLLKAANCEECW